MKIKTKKQLNLPQLIEWAWENDVRGQLFPTDQNQEAGIYIATNRDLMMNNADYIKYNNTFTVEVEEEITEDTHLDYLYVLTDAKDVHRCTNFTINTASKAIERNDLTFFTLVDNDLVKICDKGKLVE